MKVLVSFFMAILMFPIFADTPEQSKGGFHFTVIKETGVTPVKNQSRTGTCWSFATSSFIESELLRMGKGEFDLSEMFNVRMTYPLKARNYVRYHGNATLGAGSLAQDVLRVIRHYGMMPEELYDGKFAGESKHNHAEMDAVLKAALDAIVKNRGKKLSPAWPQAIEGILDAYLGKVPETFEYRGKTFTPQTFAEATGFNPNDYVELTSFTHHPYYGKFAIEVPDNWARNESYNLPLDELMAVMDHAIANGFSIDWDGDVSEKSFKGKEGVAILPALDWDDRTKAEKDSLCKHPEPEKNITQELRQKMFDDYRSSDDHLMHIVGIAKDQNGTKYYYTKNSWGTIDYKCGGYVHMSESYVRAKTISILVHKNALPKNIAKKLKLD